MLCDNCGKNEAATTLKQSVNGQSSVRHLCQECAGKLPLSNLFAVPFFNPSSLFSSLMNQKSHEDTVGETKHCSRCGTTLQEVLSSGKFGCSDCTGEFYEDLLPTIRRIHGNAVHKGKVPQTASMEIKNKRQIKALESALKEAVSEQNFERAAELRDEIMLLKEAGGENEKMV